MTRLLVVDDHPIFREALSGLLATLPDVEHVDSADSAEHALELLSNNPVDLVLMDINLPGISGVDATRQIIRNAPGTIVLIVTMVDDDDSVYAALAAGARGYVLKEASAQEITAAVATTIAGGAVFGANMAARLLTRTPPSQAQQSIASHEPLTARETEVLALLATGLTNRQIGRRLEISLKTVQNHVSRILDKIQAADRTQAILKARGLPPLGQDDHGPV